MKQLDLFIDAEATKSNGVLLGKFPAHVVDVEIGQPLNGAIPYNLVLEIAPEAAKFNGIDSETGEERSGEEMVGRKIRSVGIWLNFHPKEGWENKRYVIAMESCGVQFPEVNGKKQLAQVEREDLLGLPVIIEVGYQTNQNTGRKYLRAVKFYKWEDGKPKSIVEDVLGDI